VQHNLPDELYYSIEDEEVWGFSEKIKGKSVYS
jgi:hypothetical protein